MGVNATVKSPKSHGGFQFYLHPISVLPGYVQNVLHMKHHPKQKKLGIQQNVTVYLNQ